jgi:hypothetical protein
MTDLSGQFAVELPVGEYGVIAARDGLSASALAVTGKQTALHLASPVSYRLRAWSDSGRGVEDAALYIYLRHSKQLLARSVGAEGLVLADGVPGDDGTLIALARGHRPGIEPLDPGATYEQRIWLVLPASVSGTVDWHGIPVEGAEVSVEDDGCEYTTLTGPDGRYEWPSRRAGRLQVRARWQGKLGLREVTVVPGETADDIDVSLHAPGAILGLVLDEHARPVTHAEVLIRERATVTDESGRFLLADLVPGSYRLTATAHGYRNDIAPVRVELDEGATAQARVVLPTEASCVARLVDSSGRPVRNTRVQLSPLHVPELPPNHSDVMIGGALATTDDRGFFSAGGLTAGLFEISIEDDGRSGTVVVPCEGSIRVAERTAPRHRASVHGVVHSEKGAPVAGALVDARDLEADADEGTARTGADGTFRLGIESGTHLLTVQPERERPAWTQRRQIVINDGDDIEIDFEVPTGASISGTVIGPGAKPVSRAEVLALRGDSNLRSEGEASALTDETGAFHLSHITSEVVRIVVSARDLYQLGTLEGATARLASDDVRIVLGRPGHLRGRVVDEHGAPLRRFEVLGRPFSSPLGEFDLALEIGGPFDVTIHAEDRATVVQRVQALPETVENLGTIVLPRGRLVSGVVVDALSGAPIPDALVDPLPPIDALWFDDPSFTTRTASDGSFVLEHVAAADTLRISATGFHGRETSIESATLRIPLEALPTVTFQVVGGDDRPVPWMELRARQGPWERYVYTDATGQASIAFERAGRHLVEVRGAAGPLLEVTPSEIVPPYVGHQAVILRVRPSY